MLVAGTAFVAVAFPFVAFAGTFFAVWAVDFADAVFVRLPGWILAEGLLAEEPFAAFLAFDPRLALVADLTIFLPFVSSDFLVLAGLDFAPRLSLDATIALPTFFVVLACTVAAGGFLAIAAGFLLAGLVFLEAFKVE